MPTGRGGNFRRVSGLYPVKDRSYHDDFTSFDAASKTVCEACNNGWMNALDQQVKDLISDLAWGREQNIPANSRLLFTTWATKVALVRTSLDLEVDQHANEDVFRSFYTLREAFTQSLIQIARISEPHSATHNTSLKAKLAKPDSMDLSHSIYSSNVVSIAIGHFFFQVGIFSDSVPAKQQTKVTLAAIRRKFPNRIIPLPLATKQATSCPITPDEAVVAAEGLYLRGVHGFTGA